MWHWPCTVSFRGCLSFRIQSLSRFLFYFFFLNSAFRYCLLSKTEVMPPSKKILRQKFVSTSDHINCAVLYVLGKWFISGKGRRISYSRLLPQYQYFWKTTSRERKMFVLEFWRYFRLFWFSIISFYCDTKILHTFRCNRNAISDDNWFLRRINEPWLTSTTHSPDMPNFATLSCLDIYKFVQFETKLRPCGVMGGRNQAVYFCCHFWSY